MSESLILFIESNTSGTGRLFMRTALEKGYTPILLASDLSKYPYLEREGFTAHQIDTQDKKALLTYCHQISVIEKLSGITSSSEYFISTAAYLAHQLSLPGPKYKALEECRDKWKQRIKLNLNGINIPKFDISTNVKESVNISKKIGFPVVLKPIHGSGSIGVKLCKNEAEVVEHSSFLLSQTYNERRIPIEKKILIEEFISGIEYSVETFNKSIVGITRKYIGRKPYFIETGHDFPAIIPEKLKRDLYSLIFKTLECLDICWGANHIEVSLSQEEFGPWSRNFSPCAATLLGTPPTWTPRSPT
ncbi:MAG: ATP-grasp domain-containing protein, partial [Leptolyngbya sp. SIO3F4]|nr:ATP-grasp domain-containing protein [Leptolyngbya sp. SIO3F4]